MKTICVHTCMSLFCSTISHTLRIQYLHPMYIHYIVYNAITTYMYLCCVQLAQRINSTCICMYDIYLPHAYILARGVDGGHDR
ncbi:hypothetical protein DFP73DRAFT_570149 [Morchella snyderi]|nr:hypothetical protein DFP73DRAFT_570149 [Morchella snyderi]